MKRIAIILFTVIVFSCSKKTTYQIAKENIESEILRKANDPDSYEFVEMTEIDTLFLVEHLTQKLNHAKGNEILIELNEESIKQYLSTSERYKRLKNETLSQYSKTKARQIEIENNQLKDSIKFYEEAVTKANPKKTKNLTTNFVFRVNNKMGAKILNYYIVGNYIQSGTRKQMRSMLDLLGLFLAVIFGTRAEPHYSNGFSKNSAIQ